MLHLTATSGPREITDAMLEAAAAAIRVGELEIKALFAVEAPGGQAFTAGGVLVRRFEPHHFPAQFWPALAFAPAGEAPWRASLKLKAMRRDRMLDLACGIDSELAYRATSWGAGQIMGSNARAAGYLGAVDMVDRHVKHGAPEAVSAFCRLVVSWGLDDNLRRRDWATVARVWNGPANAKIYAGRLEREWSRLIADAIQRPAIDMDDTTLRRGDEGAAVKALQRALIDVGFELTVDGDFGPATQRAVLDWQRQRKLVMDGIVGRVTWQSLRAPAQ